MVLTASLRTLFAPALVPLIVLAQVFAGDKYGNIALWDATKTGQAETATKDVEPSSIRGGDEGDVKAKVKDEDDGEEAVADEEEGPSNGKFWLWRAHNKSSVSCLKFRPHETKKVRSGFPCFFCLIYCLLTSLLYDRQIYSSCYDMTLRSHDFETGMSEEVIDADSDHYDGLLHSFDFDPTGNEIWGECNPSLSADVFADSRSEPTATDGGGGLHWRDLRTPISEAKRWNIDRAKGKFLSYRRPKTRC